MSGSLARLLRSLQLAGLDLDAEGALDSIWLALRTRQRMPVAAAPSAPGSSGASTSAAAPAGAATATAVARPGDAGQTHEDLRARSATFAGQSSRTLGASSRTLTLPRVAALPDSRALIRALRPLRRRVASPGTGVLDIDTTVRRAAEEDLWIPSFRPARERWLDVMLVADHGLSMIIWKDTIDEFERVLRNSGAFRSVRSWWLESDPASVAISARGRGSLPATPEKLVRLVRGQARTIVFVISDCVGARWHDGAVPRLLAQWAQHVPLSLMQVTPERFWARTALGDTVSCRLRSAVPAALNHQLQLEAGHSGLSGLNEGSPGDATLFRLATAPLSSAAMARVACLIAGVSPAWTPGMMFDLSWDGEAQAPAPGLSADERATRFGTLASKAAQRLAACFAASPVSTLGMLRLLRRDLLPEAEPFIEAEVLLGGLLRVPKEKASWDLGASLPLEFHPGVQPLLLDSANAADVLRALERAAQVAQSGVVPTFTSWLENPSSGVAQLDPDRSDFAAGAAASLARLGGSFARLVKPAEKTLTEASPQAAPEPEQREFLVSGRVQGVGFRAFAQQQARSLGLKGSAENLPDGRVRVRAIGPDALLLQLEKRLRQGPPSAKVDDVIVMRQGASAAEPATSARSAPVRTVLRRGAKGSDVSELQRKLNVSPPDGNFGAQTEAAVRQFQSGRGLAADGVVGPATWKEIDAAPLPTPRRPASPRGGERCVISIGVDHVAGLPPLNAAAVGARRFADWARASQGIEHVWVFTDEDQSVGVAQVRKAIDSCIKRGDLDQLIVYFIGHGTHVAQQDLWLLSDALHDPNAAISVTSNEYLVRMSGIPQVVFISDTSRAADGAARAMIGSTIFPNLAQSSASTAVDRFFAASMGEPAYQVKAGGDVDEFDSVFTSVLLSALSGSEQTVLTEHDGRQVITSRSLAGFLRKAVPERLAQMAGSLRQVPQAIVESDVDCWLASF